MDSLKIDKWYKVLVLAGAYLIFASLHYTIEFLPQKYLFGFGLGIFFLGLSYFKSDKTVTEFVHGGMLSYGKHIPDILSVLFLLAGIACVFYFGFKMSSYMF